MPKFPFGYSILLGCVRAGFSVKNSILGEKGLKSRGVKFSTSISLELTDFASKLIFCEELEFDKGVIGLRFVKQRVKPRVPRKIINEYDVIFAATL
jgi:hypothetical protein